MQVTHQPRRKRPTHKQVRAAIRTIGAAVAWREWDAEGTRTFEDGDDAMNTYAESLYDVVTDSDCGTDEIVAEAMNYLGLDLTPESAD